MCLLCFTELDYKNGTKPDLSPHLSRHGLIAAEVAAMFPDVRPLLEALKKELRLGLEANGAALKAHAALQARLALVVLTTYSQASQAFAIARKTKINRLKADEGLKKLVVFTSLDLVPSLNIDEDVFPRAFHLAKYHRRRRGGVRRCGVAGEGATANP
jgi:hypothetical protein